MCIIDLSLIPAREFSYCTPSFSISCSMLPLTVDQILQKHEMPGERLCHFMFCNDCIWQKSLIPTDSLMTCITEFVLTCLYQAGGVTPATV